MTDSDARPLDVGAARELMSEQEQWAMKSAEECDRLGMIGLPNRRLSYIAEANLWRHRADIYRSLASSLTTLSEPQPKTEEVMPSADDSQRWLYMPTMSRIDALPVTSGGEAFESPARAVPASLSGDVTDARLAAIESEWGTGFDFYEPPSSASGHDAVGWLLTALRDSQAEVARLRATLDAREAEAATLINTPHFRGFTEPGEREVIVGAEWYSAMRKFLRDGSAPPTTERP